MAPDVDRAYNMSPKAKPSGNALRYLLKNLRTEARTALLYGGSSLTKLLPVCQSSRSRRVKDADAHLLSIRQERGRKNGLCSNVAMALLSINHMFNANGVALK